MKIASHAEYQRERYYICRGENEKRILKDFLWLFREASLGRGMLEAFLRDWSNKNQHGTRRSVGALPVYQPNNRMSLSEALCGSMWEPYRYNIFKRKGDFYYLNQNLNTSHGF